MTAFVSTWPRKTLELRDKSALVNRFLQGQSTADLSALFSVHRATVEQVLREAIGHLATFVNEDAAELAREEQNAPDPLPLNGLGTKD